MNGSSPTKDCYHLEAKYLGPILSLDCTLSQKNQNLIFATNGTGKSFLARAFRMLDDVAFNAATYDEIAESIVSEEATPKTGEGYLCLRLGNSVLGRIDLDIKNKSVKRESNVLFHVFSTDYVETELKKKNYEFDGNIEHEIVVGKENSELEAKKTSRAHLEATLKVSWKYLADNLNAGKLLLKKKFSINAQLSEYKNLLQDFWLEPNFIADMSISLDNISSQYETYKKFPINPEIPKIASEYSLDFPISELKKILAEEVSLSTVEEKFRQKIKQSPEFFKKGLSLLDDSESECPFCTQGLNAFALDAVKAYRAFFEDYEAKTIAKLERYSTLLGNEQNRLLESEKLLLKNIARYDELKTFFNELKTNIISNHESKFKKLNEHIDELNKLIEQKRADISTSININDLQFHALVSEISDAYKNINKNFIFLNSKVENIDDERKSIQRRACIAFKNKFYFENKSLCEEIEIIESQIGGLIDEIAELEKFFGDKVLARSKVADTFSYFLNFIFGDKYSFDAKTFTVKRNKQEMSRGGDRTLSDGEKSVIGFCYYIAQIHLRVQTDNCYEKLFLVIDDPVSSLSYDYIYSISQILKCIQISDGKVHLKNIPNPRPRLLILTHNDYLYNIAVNNNTVKGDAVFQLVSANNDKHQLIALKTFITPHLQNLTHVFNVSQGTDLPKHYTANSIRAIIEGMWRFCRPDISDFNQFIQFASEQTKLPIKSVLIHDLSHGPKFGSTSYMPDEIRDAASQAIALVEYFAIGQIQNLK